MKTLRSISGALVAFILFTGYSPVKLHNQRVYLCDSKASLVYHPDRNCRGLEHCKHTIFTTTKDSAIHFYSRRACKICAGE